MAFCFFCTVHICFRRCALFCVVAVLLYTYTKLYIKTGGHFARSLNKLKYETGGRGGTRYLLMVVVAASSHSQSFAKRASTTTTERRRGGGRKRKRGAFSRRARRVCLCLLFNEITLYHTSQPLWPSEGGFQVGRRAEPPLRHAPPSRHREDGSRRCR